MPPTGSRNLALAAVLANTALVIAKLIAAAVTGSAAILAEAIHSIAAATSHALILVGLVRATGPASPRHTTRRVRELRFWTSVVPISLYSLGAGVAINEGIAQLQHPHPLSDATTGYAVLAVALLAQVGLAHRAWRQLCARPDISTAAAAAISLETKAGAAGLAAAVAGVSLSHGLGWTVADGLASVAIGLAMGCVAALMAIETKALIVGDAGAAGGETGGTPAGPGAGGILPGTPRKPEKIKKIRR